MTPMQADGENVELDMIPEKRIMLKEMHAERDVVNEDGKANVLCIPHSFFQAVLQSA